MNLNSMGVCGFMIQRPRGTRDFLPDEMEKRRFVESKLRVTAKNFGYKEIATPTFEHTELFTIKSGPNIVNQMYTFKDKGGRDISLRPELTAPALRFYVSEMKNLPKPLKVYYFGNCFRYEEPQSGRFREFWQFGAESIGSKEAESDAEVIALAVYALKNAGLNNFVTRIGHLGILRSILSDVPPDVQSSVMALIDKRDFGGLKERLSDAKSDAYQLLDEIMNLSGNVIDRAREILKEGRALESLNQLEEVLRFLELFGVNDYKVDLGIARGIDYYVGMVFEIDCPVLGAEKQVCGGGNYELAEVFGLESVSSTGFAIGFDRVMIALEREGKEIPSERLKVFVVPASDVMRKKSLEITTMLRKHGIPADVDLMRRGLSKNMKFANAVNAEKVVIVGEDELKENSVTLRDMNTGFQERVLIDELVKKLRK